MADTAVLNSFGIHRLDNRTSFFGDYTPLGQGVGYGLVVGFGVFFGVITTLLVGPLPDAAGMISRTRPLRRCQTCLPLVASPSS